MDLRLRTWVIALIVAASLAALAADAVPAARRFDLVTYSPPNGWKVEEKAGEHVSISRTTPDSYCLIAIYTSTPASSDLAASFAAEWTSVALRTVDAVDAPTPSINNVGNTRAALGGATTTIQGQSVAAILIVLDVGPNVVSILILTPSTQAFEAFSAEVQGMLGGLSVRHAEAPPVTTPTAPLQNAGKLIVPPPSRALTLVDLVGEWGHEDGITTTYVDRYSGAYAGYDSLHFREKWTISAQGVVRSDFFAIRNGKKIVDKNTGSIGISGQILDVKVGAAAKYVVRGWLEGPEMTVLKITGPFYEGIPQDVLDNPDQGANLNQYWVRQAKIVKPK